MDELHLRIRFDVDVVAQKIGVVLPRCVVMHQHRAIKNHAFRYVQFHPFRRKRLVQRGKPIRGLQVP